MILLIAGSRTFTDYSLLEKEASRFENVTSILSGTARGADRLGERYAREKKLPVIKMPADWDTFGKSAGYIRNEAMIKKIASEKGSVLLFWDGVSRGTKHTIDLCEKYNVPVRIVLIERK